jgi:hypothetical protein
MIDEPKERYKDLKNSIIKGMATGAGSFLVTTFLSGTNIIQLSLESILLLALVFFVISYMFFLSRANVSLRGNLSQAKTKIRMLECSTVWSYFNVENIDQELTDSGQTELSVSRQEVSPGDALRVKFSADRPVDFFIKEMDYRKKISEISMEAMAIKHMGPRERDSLPTYQTHMHASVIDKKSSNIDWKKEILVDRPADWYFVAVLPNGIPGANVKIIVEQLKKIDKRSFKISD